MAAVTVHTDVCAPGFHGCRVDVGADGHGAALDAFSADAALDTATRHAVARSVWLGKPALGAARHVGSATSLTGAALLLDTIAGYSAALRARHAASLGWTSATELAWIEARSLTRRARRWIPLQLAIGPPPRGRDERDEPELRPRIGTGVAAHANRAAATLDALREVVERDAFMLTWLGRLPAAALDVAGGPGALVDVARRLAAAGVEPRAVRLVTDVPVPVVLGLVLDSSGAGPAVAAAASARSTVTAAAIDALTRAFASWRDAKRLAGAGTTRAEDPAQLDRDGRLVWWADRRRLGMLGWLLDASIGRAIADDEERDTATDAELDRLINWFASAGEDVLVVELTDTAVAEQLGHHVVTVVVPGFHPLHLDESRPARWSHRLRTVPTALGLPVPPVVNTLPHPLG